MSDLHKAFPPIPLRDDVPSVCLAIALLGLVVCGFFVAVRMHTTDSRVAIATTAPAK